MEMKKILLVALMMVASAAANAHTIAVGSTNAGGAGSVNIWLGAYSHGGAYNEGSITLNGVTQSFNLLVATIPTGLVAGDNYHYATTSPGGSFAGDFNSATNTTGQTVAAWQGAQFNGLAAGTYQYQVTGMNTVHWNDWNSLTPNWTGYITITDATSQGVPEPTTLALLGLGLAGMGFARKQKKA